MRFLVAGLKLCRWETFLTAAGFSAEVLVAAFFAEVAFTGLAFAAAHRFFCAAEMRLRAAGLSLRRLAVLLAGLASPVAAEAVLPPESRARARCSFSISLSIARTIRSSSIPSSQARKFEPQTTITCGV